MGGVTEVWVGLTAGGLVWFAGGLLDFGVDFGAREREDRIYQCHKISESRASRLPWESCLWHAMLALQSHQMTRRVRTARHRRMIALHTCCHRTRELQAHSCRWSHAQQG